MSTKKFQRLLVGAGAAAAALALSAGVASAEPIGPNGPAKKPGYCAVVNTDSNGNETVTYVPTGTRSGLSYCGADGEWHLGWLVDGLVSQPPSGTKGPVNVGAVGPVLSAKQ